MIQPAVSSLSSSLALAVGTQAAPGDEAAVSGGFAAVLTASVAPTPNLADGATVVPALTAGALPGQPSGNLAGKTLPLALPDAVPAQPAEPAPALPAASAPIFLPGLVVPASVQLPQALKSARPEPSAEQSTADNLASTAAAQLVRAAPSAAPAKPAKASARSEKATVADDDTQADSANTEKVAAPPAPAEPMIMPSVLPVQVALTNQPVVEAKTVKAKASASPARPATTPASVVPVAQAPTAAAAQSGAGDGKSTPTVVVAAAPAVPKADEAASVVIGVALPQTSLAAPLPAGPAPVTPVASQVVVQAIAPKTAQKQGDQPATPQIKAVDEPASPQPVTASAAATATARTDQNAAKQNDAPAAAPARADGVPSPQPTLPIIDAQSVSQPVVAASIAPTTSVQQGHDFAALVDRLVEAREAASPQAVHAAVSHSEFGKVTLRFDQDASGLSVAMSSADPDFARAVQASAAPQTASDTGTAPRHEAPAQQQSGGSFSGQTQSQGQSQANGREDRNAPARNDARFANPAGRQRPDEESTDTRGGIYA